MLCKTCHTDKPSECFYPSNKTRCRECVIASVKENRLAKIDYYRAYDRMRGSMPHRVAARDEYAKTEQGKAALLRARLASKARLSDRVAARNMVNNAVRDGRLRPLPCWVCGEKAQAHHPDYSSPLDVVWLCQPHHKQTHALVERP